jgi:Flp pilus assembly pilin Flp
MRGREIEIFAAVQRWVREEEGQSVVEYSLLLTMLAATFVLVATMMGVNVIRLMQHSSTMTIDSTPVSRWRFDQP